MKSYNFMMSFHATSSDFHKAFLSYFRILAGCGFSGNIPDELGNLSELSFL